MNRYTGGCLCEPVSAWKPYQHGRHLHHALRAPVRPCGSGRVLQLALSASAAVLREWLAHPLFQQAMVKFPPWREGDELVVFP